MYALKSPIPQVMSNTDLRTSPSSVLATGGLLKAS